MGSRFLNIPPEIKLKYLGDGSAAPRHLTLLLERIECSNIGFNPIMEINAKVRGVYYIVPHGFQITGHEAKKDHDFKIKYDGKTKGGSLVSMANGLQLPISVTLYNSYQDFLAI